MSVGEDNILTCMKRANMLYLKLGLTEKTPANGIQLKSFFFSGALAITHEL